MPSTVHALLEKLNRSATSERDKGDKFERLVRKFLTFDPQFGSRFSRVHMWMDWADRNGQPDRGIDLVAIERETEEPVAVQCKFYEPSRCISKKDVDTFLAESGKHPFVSRLIVSTTDKWNPNAEAAIKNQQIPVSRIGLTDLTESSIDWDAFDFLLPEQMELRPRKQLLPHQMQALEKVREGFVARDRGKLIMACGTGKTFTSLKIAENLVGPDGTVLFLVPSIALLSQSLKEWSIESETPLRSFAVCSDAKVGKGKGSEDEDISVVDLEIPATTDPERLIDRVIGHPWAGEGRMTVVFSTYQSIDVISQAQKRGLPEFDLIVCDEAHRTTGATLPGADESAFVKVHDGEYLKASKRLYMTATPRLYDDNSKLKAGQSSVVLASMDDLELYGPEFHRLGFGEAVSQGLLTDYKVLILTVDETAVSRTMQSTLSADGELSLPDAARIIGCWNGLAKRGDSEHGFEVDPQPMRRAVAFAQSIKVSKAFEAQFGAVTDDFASTLGLETADGPLLRAEVHHVDGTMNILKRNLELDWLRSDPPAGECRILSNARCLAEGVDLPTLDAVMFLNPRKSVVDIVQAVGRVMRLSPGKAYGYIILPIGIPAGETPSEVLRKDNARFRVVWEVLQALRAHDERFDAMVNKIDLNNSHDPKIDVFNVRVTDDEERDGSGQLGRDDADSYPQLQFEWLEEWRNAIYAKLVDKVGSRTYWEDWAKDVADIVAAHTTRLKGILSSGDTVITEAFGTFLDGLRRNLNDSITADDAIDMLSQHMITKPVFDALFEDYSFMAHNAVAKVMQEMLEALEGQHLEKETENLEGFYDSVRIRVQGIDNAAGKQRILMELYEKFFRLAFKKTSESLGIVYTPVEIVDFIIRGVDELLKEHFDSSLSDEGVHVLDPFTGTGTFIVRLLESGLIRPEDLQRKYAGELHANEILLLAYYIAAANIEVTYHTLAGQAEGDYTPFEGIVLADTFQMTEDGDTLDETVFAANNDRAAAQLKLPIRVIVGNPPYSVGQSSGNDDNANLKYPTLDGKIESTYVACSTATSRRTLYDSYIRAIRWASDRVGVSGIVAYVSNGGYIDSNTADGLRKTLIEEFDSIYVFNLRGNQRTAGELSRKEGGKVFGSGSRSTVAILLLVKKPDSTAAKLFYRDIGDYLSREEKLRIVTNSQIASIPWEAITPNNAGDWVNQRTGIFGTYSPIGDKTGATQPVFRMYSLGVATGRDPWAYNSSRTALVANAENMIVHYNTLVTRARSIAKAKNDNDLRGITECDLDLDPARVSWNANAMNDLRRGREYEFESDSIRLAAYRPFVSQHLCFSTAMNARQYRQREIFPTNNHPNHGFYVVGAGSDKPFSTLMVSAIPDLALWGSSNGQFFPRYRYQPVAMGDSDGQDAFDLEDNKDEIVDGYRRIDNLTDTSLKDYQTAYGAQVTKDDIFYYVYGLLHSPDYRLEFAADLRKMLPRIPKVDSRETFGAFVKAGRDLAALHIGYEDVEPYPGLTIAGDNPEGDPHAWYRLDKMRYGKKDKETDKTQVHYNSRITVSGIPEEAHEYLLGARSAVDWILERYQVKTDKASGIINDPNDWSREHDRPRYILDLLTKIVTVSVRTVEIVGGLPALSFSADGAGTFSKEV